MPKTDTVSESRLATPESGNIRSTRQKMGIRRIRIAKPAQHPKGWAKEDEASKQLHQVGIDASIMAKMAFLMPSPKWGHASTTLDSCSSNSKADGHVLGHVPSAS